MTKKFICIVEVQEADDGSVVDVWAILMRIVANFSKQLPAVKLYRAYPSDVTGGVWASEQRQEDKLGLHDVSP